MSLAIGTLGLRSFKPGQVCLLSLDGPMGGWLGHPSCPGPRLVARAKACLVGRPEQRSPEFPSQVRPLQPGHWAHWPLPTTLCSICGNRGVLAGTTCGALPRPRRAATWGGPCVCGGGV